MSAHATLDSVDAIKHKLSDAEYKLIVDNLQRQHCVSTKHFLIQYQVTQCWYEKVYHDSLDEELVRLVSSESKHTAIVRTKPNCDTTVPPCIAMLPGYLLPALRRAEVPEFAITEFQEDIEKHGFYNNAATEHGLCAGNTAPWAGVNQAGSDVITKIMVVKCDAYTL